MHKRRRIYLFFSLALLAFPVAGQDRDLKITVQPASDSRFRIAITFTGDPDGSTDIILPNEWGGQQELYKSISDLAVDPAVAGLKPSDQLHKRTVIHRPGEKIVLSYLLSNGFEGPYRNAVRYRPVIDKDHIQWIGNAVWALPAWDDSTLVTSKFVWKDFPKSWAIANSFASGKRSHSKRIRMGELRQAVFVAGDFRLVQTRAGTNPVNIAVRGKWKFADAALAEMTRKVIETERIFFNDHSQKYYLVTLNTIDEGPNALSLGGTGLTDSFALFATPNAELSRFRNLLAHEYAHNWIPGKLGRMPAQDEQALYWFSEGFTEFYTYELLRRGKLITDEEYVSRYNELIREYYMLPVRNAPNDRILKDFWSDRNVQRLPYLRGFLFATNLNAAIKRSSAGKHSLDDAVLEMFKSEKAELSIHGLAAIFRRFLGEDPTELMTRHLVNGDLVVPAHDALGSNFSQSLASIPIYELGFDFDRFAKDRIVSDVKPDSAAYAAGLRNGQTRNGGVSLAFGDTTKEIELKVKDDEGEKIIRYVPVAKQSAEIPQFRLAETSH